MKTSNWVKAKDGDRYGGGEVYAFTHKDDAHKWAGRMDWAHNQKLGSGKISIVTAKRPHDREFEVDHNDPLSQAGKSGDWMKTHGSIEPHHIVSVEKYSPKKLGEDVVPFAKKGDLPVLPTTYVSDPEHIKKAKSDIWNKNYSDWKERKKAERIQKANEDKVAVFHHETQLQNVRMKETGVKRKKKMKDPRPTDFSRPSLKEVAAPGKEHWIKANKARFIAKYGKEKGTKILYAKAWKDSKKLSEDKIGKKTPSVEEIAKKHNITVDQVNAQIKKGIEVEKEHTADEGMAHEIARDHLGEFPDYYDRLGAMEKSAKKSQVKEAKKTLKGFKMMVNDPPVPASNTASPVTLKGYERVKDGKFNVLRKLKESHQYDPEKEAMRNRIAAHKDVAAKMAKQHGDKSHQAAFHRALVKRWEKELGEDTNLEEAVKKPKKKKQSKRAWQAQAILAKKSGDVEKVRAALRAHAQRNEEKELDKPVTFDKPKPTVKMAKGALGKTREVSRLHAELLKKQGWKVVKEEVANSVGGGMSPVVGGEGNIHGFDPIMGKPVRRRKFAGKQVFVVDPTTYHKAYLGKRKNEHYEKYLAGSPMADEIREYGRKNWDESIIIENEQTGAMVYLKYGRK
jgi:hypothetical protein